MTDADVTIQAVAGTEQPLVDGEETRDLERGATVGRYVVIDEIGRGAMGVVYAAYDPQLDRKVALKLLHTASSEREARLLREAQALARLSHRNVITVHDVGTLEGQVFVAMEYIEGRTLTQWLAEKKRGWREILFIFVRAGRGLEAAHAGDLVHRDFKPDNVLIGHDGEVRVMDFGLARGSGEAEIESVDLTASASMSTLETELTQTGALLGTPRYMAPEQHRSGPADARADQFSFCVALYEGLYGTRPFKGSNVAALAYNVMQGNVLEPPKDADVPTWLRRHIYRGLRVKPSDRFPSMVELLAELERDPSAERKRWAAGIVGVGALVAAVAFGTSSRQTEVGSPGAVCEGARERLSGVWDDARREAVAASFRATQRPYSEDALGRVTELLDKYADEWVAMRDDACEATHLRGEQSEDLLDLRMHCLGDRRQQLSALGELFSSADERVVLQAVRAAHALSPIDRCGDTEALLARVPPPEDPEVRQQVDELELQLTKAVAISTAGQVQDSMAEFRRIAQDATQLGYRPLEGRALQQLARITSKVDPKQAEDPLHRAAWAAQAGGDDETLANAMVMLLHVVGYKLARHDEGERWAGYAEAAIARLGGHPRLEARLLTERGTLAFARGDNAKAQELLTRGLELRRTVLRPDDPELAASMNNLGSVLKQQGKTHEAIALYRDVVDRLEKSLGRQHPDIAVGLNNLGAVLRDAQDLDGAQEAYARSLAIHERSSGEDSRSVGLVVTNIGDLLTQRGRFDEAITHHRRAKKIFETVHGPEHPYVGAAHLNIGHALRLQGQLDAADVEYSEALRLFTAALGESHPFVAEVLTGQGRVLLDRGKARAAVAPLERARGIREGAGASDRERAETAFALARALTGKGSAQVRARELAEKARDTFQEVGGDAQSVAEIQAWLTAH